jgi:glycine hydroxymethyltransferase
MKPGEKFLGLDLSMGGHLTHGSAANFSGKTYQAIHYGVTKDGYVDYDQLEAKARAEKPKMIICGASAYSRDWDYKRIRAVADEVGAVVFADIAHPAGLIASGLLSDPFDHCHIVSSTTHKTLRGPRAGMVLCRQELAAAVDKITFPGIQGGPLIHIIAAKAVCFREALQPAFKDYAVQVVANARALARKIMDEGFRVITGGTDTHLMLIDVFAHGILGSEAENALGQAGITVNKNAIPFDANPPLKPSGIRIGSQTLTTSGMREKEMVQTGAWIVEARKN